MDIEGTFAIGIYGDGVITQLGANLVLTFDDDIMWPPPVWLKHNDGDDPVIRFGFRAMGMIVMEIEANVTLNGENIATHYYDAWGPGGLRNIDVPIDSLGEGNIEGELRVELSSRYCSSCRSKGEAQWNQIMFLDINCSAK